MLKASSSTARLLLSGIGHGDRARNLPRLLTDELAQARVVLVARGTALKMRAHARKAGVGVLAGELEVDVLVEQLEASIAADLRLIRAEQPGDEIPLRAVCAHFRAPVWPWSCRS